jgi:hypothetical protein
VSQRRFSISYVDGLLGQHDRDAITQIGGIICSSSAYDSAQPLSGLPEALFCFIQVLAWEAHSWRSGVWTYYEATSYRIQEEVSLALERLAPLDLAKAYRDGTRLWRSPSAANAIDEWLKANESRVLKWLNHLVLAERDAVQRLA